MSTEEAASTSTGKRKPTEEPDAVVSNSNNCKDQRKSSKSKTRRVSTDASVSTATSQQTTEAISEAASVAQQDDSIISIGALVRDLFCSDHFKVNAALDALNLDLGKDKKKCDKIQAVGGCLALVVLINKCLDTAIYRFPACDRLTKLNELDEMKTLFKTLRVMTDLMLDHDASRIGITAIGGVEAVIKAMKTLPKCHEVVAVGCHVLLNLAFCRIGKKKVAETGGIEVVLAAINNYLDSAYMCDHACTTLCCIVAGSNDNTELFIYLGGASAVAKVKRRWPGHDSIQNQMRPLSKSIAAHFNRWATEGDEQGDEILVENFD
jgi:hypothetical protein